MSDEDTRNEAADESSPLTAPVTPLTAPVTPLTASASPPSLDEDDDEVLEAGPETALMW